MSKLPTGIRFKSNAYRWEVTRNKRRLTGSAATVKDAVRDREQALTALTTGDMTILNSKQRASVVKHYNLGNRFAVGRANSGPRGSYQVEEPEEYDLKNCPTLLQTMQRMFATTWKDAKSLRTLKLNATGILDFFGPETKVSDIGQAAIDSYINHCETVRGNSGATVNRKLAILSKMFKSVYKRGYIKSMPVLERMPESEGRIRFLTKEEEEKILGLLKHWGRDREYNAVILLVDTGIRTGEMYKLKVEDCRFNEGKHGIIYLHETKNGTSRAVPLTERAAEAIKYLIRTSKDPERVLPEQEQWLRHTWDRVRDVLGYKDDPFFVPHILRHTCCSRLVQRGAPLKKVQQWLGHKSITTTMRYAHLCPTDLLGLTNLLEDDEEENATES